MIVCHCQVVSDRDVAACVHEGARSLADVCRLTGAGRNCGVCILSVRRLLDEQSPSRDASSMWEVEGAAS